MKKLELMEIADSNTPDAGFAKKLVKQIDKNELTPGKAKKMMDAYLEKEMNKLPPLTAGELREGTYSVFVCYPPTLPEKGEKITDVKNAALLLFTTVQKSKEMIEVMESWDFKLKEVGVLDMSGIGGKYFKGHIKFLLLGIKGNMETQANQDYEMKCPVIFKDEKFFIKNPDYKIPECIYDMAERMFPDQRYMDLCTGTWPRPVDSDNMVLSNHDARALYEYENKLDNSIDSEIEEKDEPDDDWLTDT